MQQFKSKLKSKSRKRTPLSPEERERRRQELERRREQRRASVRRLLYAREETAKALGVSISTVIRLENEKKLSKVRLRGKNGQVFNRVEDVEALAAGGK